MKAVEWWLLMRKQECKNYLLFFRFWETYLKRPLPTSSVLTSKMLVFVLILLTLLFVAAERNMASTHCKHRPLNDSVMVKQVFGSTGLLLLKSVRCPITTGETDSESCKDWLCFYFPQLRYFFWSNKLFNYILYFACMVLSRVSMHFLWIGIGFPRIYRIFVLPVQT